MVGGCSLLIVLIANAGFAEGTRTWTQSKFEELAKGTATGVALGSRGGIELAPEFKQVYATPSTYIWAITADDAGNVYAAAGSPARVYQVSPDGRAVVIFEAKELQVQAITMSGGVVYAATAPDGKLYRIEHRGAKVEAAKTESGKRAVDISMPPVDASWSATEVFAPKSKYIWSLLADVQGNIYVGTGDPGEIHKVTPKGEHSLFFKSDETHIRVLALDGKGNIIAGSDGSGLIYRISMTGEGFVLFSAPKKEITALALDGAGNIYAAAAGEKHTGGGSSSGAVPLLTPMAGLSANGPGAAIQPQAPGVGNALGGIVGGGLFPFAGVAGAGSEIYKISPDGTPQRTWVSRDDLVYALAVDGGGQLLAGTGNKGRVFAVPGMDEYSDLGKATAAQVTAFAWTRDGVLHVATSNLGKIFAMGPKPPAEGTFESDVFDAKAHSRWGRVEFRGAGNVDLFARSGNVDNPDRNWSAWKRVDLGKDSVAQVPMARFAQWKAVLHAGTVAPRVESVGLNYLPRNIAPDVDEVTVQVGVKYQPQPKMGGAGGPEIGANTGIPHFESSAPSTRERDSIGVKWSAHDDNDDQLVYSLYYRGDGESQWLLLKDSLTDKSYSFDASLLPDGGYTVRVVASDAPSHAPGESLTATKESARFEVDTTPPRIEELAASLESGQIHIRFHAVDGFSPIKKAEYSLDAGEWRYVEPVAQISDAKTEDYDFHVPLAAGVEHVVVVRVYDRYENLGAAKTVVRGK